MKDNLWQLVALSFLTNAPVPAIQKEQSYVLLRIIRDSQTAPITPREFISQIHYRGKAILSSGPTAQLVSIPVTVMRGRFQLKAKSSQPERGEYPHPQGKRVRTVSIAHCLLPVQTA